jgi:tetratricopeptide (TPR) repeat protein
MAEDALPGASLRAEYEAISTRLEAAVAPEQREAVKREIFAFFMMVDGTLTELTQLKEDIRALVDRYKQGAPLAAAAPEFSGARPSVHEDHIGASTFIEKGWSLISLGDHAGAIQALTRALELSPGAVEAQSLLGWAQMLHEDHIGASTFIEKGWSLISLGDHAGAIQALARALELSPGAVEAQSLLGWAQMLHEDYDEALATFSKVLMNEPTNALARINVGYICLKKRIFGEAIEHLSRAIRLDNDKKATLYAHFYLGLVYLERDMFEDAQTFFRKTLALGPNLIEAYFQLGRTQWLAGDRPGAVEAWTAGQKANKFNPWARRCGELLALAAAGGEIPRSQFS